MSRIRRHSAFPHRWPVQLAGAQSPGVQGSGARPAPAAAREVLSAALQPANGELTASPRLGLHYETEGAQAPPRKSQQVPALLRTRSPTCGTAWSAEDSGRCAITGRRPGWRCC